MVKLYKTLFLLFFLLNLSTTFSQDISPQKLFETFSNSVVVIRCLDQSDRKKTQGSGVILADKKILITNFHVFAGSEKMEITHKDSVINYSEISGINIEKDIMVIKLDDDNFPQINIGNSSELKIGDRVYAIGSPLGMENTISEGIVSGFRILGEDKRNRIQITASISSGSSGGAVFNSRGELVGISSSKLLKGENINFMIPINDVLSVADSGLYDKRTIQALKLFYKGSDAYENGNLTEAINLYTKYIEIVPNECKAYNYRGKAYLGKKELESALKDFQKALDIDRVNKPAMCNRGECFYMMEEYEKALKDFSKVIALDSTYYYAFFARGLTYFKLEKYKNSLKDYNLVLYHKPEDITTLINRGIVYFELKEYEKALIDWKKVVSIDPSYEKSLQQNIEIATYYWWNK
ncbi:MAG: tetratricopeptide repeat protein [Ignavibacteria bacterium]|jgi:lipoprotein NlpI